VAGGTQVVYLTAMQVGAVYFFSLMLHLFRASGRLPHS
jgi:hypothetical protein